MGFKVGQQEIHGWQFYAGAGQSKDKEKVLVG